MTKEASPLQLRLDELKRRKPNFNPLTTRKPNFKPLPSPSPVTTPRPKCTTLVTIRCGCIFGAAAVLLVLGFSVVSSTSIASSTTSLIISFDYVIFNRCPWELYERFDRALGCITNDRKLECLIPKSPFLCAEQSTNEWGICAALCGTSPRDLHGSSNCPIAKPVISEKVTPDADPSWSYTVATYVIDIAWSLCSPE